MWGPPTTKVEIRTLASYRKGLLTPAFKETPFVNKTDFCNLEKFCQGDHSPGQMKFFPFEEVVTPNTFFLSYLLYIT